MLKDMLERIRDAHAVNRLSKSLLKLKEERALGHRNLKATGSYEELCDSISEAIDNGHLSLDDIAKIVNEVEENGRQHIFLFSEENTKYLSDIVEQLSGNFPHAQTSDVRKNYAKLPAEDRVWYEDRSPTHILKFTGTTSYWTINAEQSQESEERIVIVKDKRQSRVIHLLKVHSDSGLIEVRIQAAGADAPSTQWKTDFFMFANLFSSVLPLEQLSAVPIWKGFRSQIKETEGTYLVTDEAFEAQTTQRISLRREHGKDLREHKDYDLDDIRFARDTLNIYWFVHDQEDDEYRIHTIQQRVNLNKNEYAKVWISRHVPNECIDILLDRIIGRI